MRIIFLFISILLFAQESFAYTFVKEKIGATRAEYFSIPHDDSYHVIASASNTGTSLRALIETVGGVAGINGAYFIPRDYTKLPDTTNTVRIIRYDGFSYSKYFPDTGPNAIFGFLHDGTPILAQNNIWWEKTLRQNYHSGMLLDIEYGIANFPILLFGARDMLSLYERTTLITEKMRAKSSKTFICRTEKNDIKMWILKNISLMNVPSVLLSLGCTDAINLDNGGSLAIYDKQKYIYGPGRNIMDGFVIVKK